MLQYLLTKLLLMFCSYIFIHKHKNDMIWLYFYTGNPRLRKFWQMSSWFYEQDAKIWAKRAAVVLHIMHSMQLNPHVTPTACMWKFYKPACSIRIICKNKYRDCLKHNIWYYSLSSLSSQQFIFCKFKVLWTILRKWSPTRQTFYLLNFSWMIKSEIMVSSKDDAITLGNPDSIEFRSSYIKFLQSIERQTILNKYMNLNLKTTCK